MKYFYFIVEGPHDLAALARIIRLLDGNVREILKMDELPELWRKFVPGKYPFNENTLDRISPVPSFYTGNNFTFAIKIAGSDSKIFDTLNEIFDYSINIEDIELIDGIMVIADADNKTRQEKIEFLKAKIKKPDEYMRHIKGFNLDDFIQKRKTRLFSKNIKTGIYVLPDNDRYGLLEDILLNLATIQYPDLLSKASEYINSVDKSKYKTIEPDSKSKKAVVGCITNVLRPGVANHSSIAQDEWICEKTLQSCDTVRSLYNYLKTFILD